jgi:hypothetical protein
MDIELISQLVIEYLTKVAEMKPPKEVKCSELKELTPDERAELKGWGYEFHPKGNPPSWVAEPKKWARAKKIMKRYWKKYEEPFGSVAALYLGNFKGKTKHKKKSK